MSDVKLARSQQGYLLLLSVVFIMVIGVMGSLVAYNASNRSRLSVDQLNGLKVFYNAESALEAATRYLTRPSLSTSPVRIACNAVTGNAQLTNASLGGGTFTATTVSSPIFATNTLSASTTAAATSMNVTSTSGFAPRGSLTADNELINYAAISGNTFIGLSRGVGGTQATSHASGAGVGQYQCVLDVQAGIPSIASPMYKRELESSVRLQNAWAVADTQSNNFMLLNWNRSTELAWTLNTLAGGSSAANLNAISMLSDADAWAVGNRANNNFIFLRWNGSSWALNALAGSCTNQNLLGVSMISSTEGYSVGARYRAACAASGPYRYTILRWNGSAWSLLTPSTSPSIPTDSSDNQNLNAVHVIDTDGDGVANIGFAVGDRPSGLNSIILKYNGSNWVADTSPTIQVLNGVYTVSASEAWAVGAGGVILKWNGSTWSSVTSPVTTTLNEIAMYDSDGDGLANYGLAVGASGRILTYNGSTWSFVDLGSTNFTSVDLYNTQDAWVGGAGGALYHWDGSNWVSVTSGTTRQINGISLVHQGNNPASSWRQVFD